MADQRRRRRNSGETDFLSLRGIEFVVRCQANALFIVQGYITTEGGGGVGVLVINLILTSCQSYSDISERPGF